MEEGRREGGKEERNARRGDRERRANRAYCILVKSN